MLHRAAQLAWHCPAQVVPPSLEDAHAPEQLPWHVALQSVLQSKVPAFAEHLPEQPPWQEVSQLGAVTLHPPAQVASSCASQASCTFGGAQAMSHEPVTSAVHVSLPLKTVPPQSEKMSARAGPAANTTVAAATKARSERELFTGDLQSQHSHKRAGQVEAATLGEFIDRHARDVGARGIFLRTTSPSPLDTLVQLEIQLASGQTVLSGLGRVVWRRDAIQATADRAAGMGVKFVKLDERSRAFVGGLVTARAEAGQAYEAEADRVRPRRLCAAPRFIFTA